MSQLTGFRKLACVAVLLLFAVSLSAGEKKLMHCFAFTPLASATEADWQAFFKATDDIPAKIPVVSKVWYGKLRRPLATFATDAETNKKAVAIEKKKQAGEKLIPEEEKLIGTVTRATRTWGVCMEMTGEEGLAKTYTEHPYHKEWDAIYQKVRQYGTTTYDILGQ